MKTLSLFAIAIMFAVSGMAQNTDSSFIQKKQPMETKFRSNATR